MLLINIYHTPPDDKGRPTKPPPKPPPPNPSESGLENYLRNPAILNQYLEGSMQDGLRLLDYLNRTLKDMPRPRLTWRQRLRYRVRLAVSAGRTWVGEKIAGRRFEEDDW